MNSEELELSLRSEFESHLKMVVADMRQEFTQLQAKVEAEFEKQKSQIDAVFQEYSTRLVNNTQLEGGFAETVIEHLRLARDEGARVSATAFEEAERMAAEDAAAAAPKVGIAELSRAISDITAQDSQATILKSLVQNAAQFTPRGAFFIIKNEHFVGWRVFGKEGNADEQAAREVFFPVAASTTLGESVRDLSAVESSYGTYSDDSIYLNKLNFGQPERMYAIPLVARGRGVAVLYADYGTRGEEVNFEALETLVRVAGMTVEVLAAAPIPKPAQDFQTASGGYAPPAIEESPEEYTESAPETSEEFQTVSDAQPEETPIDESADYSAQPDAVSADDNYSAREVEEIKESAAAVSVEERAEETAEQTSSWNQSPVVEATEIVEEAEVVEDNSTNYQPPVSDSDRSDSQLNDYQLAEPVAVEEIAPKIEDTAPKIEDTAEETAQFESPTSEPIETSPVEVSYTNGRAETAEVETFEPVKSEPVASPPPARSRFSDRNVDLPIEVGEDERRLHNDARRFARLLVSEIKLYNEQKVKEGREAQDLYERLREAIDRSRDMYDKRVQPPVAAKFDYFHYELVSSLAEGEETRLGGGYPGAAV